MEIVTGRGNTPAESIFERVLPNAVTVKSGELFAQALVPLNKDGAGLRLLLHPVAALRGRSARHCHRLPPIEDWQRIRTHIL